ncbi:MAG: DUF1499 domain-containing protein [Candidatus Latescibacteria bacterium]|nr:DUF1499 domain-containing protein [Candidatus Latescibacterota bacterium]NIO78921.1 DUF1499 domain-containing protein [Candidatus Latescibacterota bacterium]
MRKLVSDRIRRALIRLSLLGALLLLAGCTTTASPELGITGSGKLPPCPDTPNCASSDATDDAHSIEPLALGSDPEMAWEGLLVYLRSDPSYTIVTQDKNYIRAEARTRVFRFVDDVEFHLRPEDKQIAMRSASRIGFSDFGTNRRRLEAVRRALKEAGVLRHGD